MDRLAAASSEQLTQIRDVGPVVAQSVADFFSRAETVRTLEKLKSHGVNMRDTESPPVSAALSGLTFVITGTLDGLSRAEATARIEAAGGRVTSAVTGKTDYVLAGAEAGSKLDRARELGIKVLTQPEWEELIGHGR
jgi:DNA ligase (NAD+)